MSFFSTLLNKNGLLSHDGRPIWKYFLTDQDFEDLSKELRYTTPNQVDPRDAALYYAEWWKRSYKGGKPSKEMVFNSLEGNLLYYIDLEEFYKIAIKGGQILGFRWIVKQNTLKFKTLLLQGGLPLTHIKDNQGRYLDFLLAVLEEQPEMMEDFIFQPHITNLLPKSSQNDTIYENCFEIVRSILNKESIYDELLESDKVLKNISGQLKVRANQLEKKVRTTKPKNYWLLSKNEGEVKIRLTLGMAEKYTKEALSNILGFETAENEYQLYLNDKFVCAFKKMINGGYKTYWFNQRSHNWNGDDNLPSVYVMKDGKKIEVNDFIQTTPSFNEPTLWTRFSENEWRLIKGSGSTDKNAALLFPLDWNASVPYEKMFILGNEMNWLEFEGEFQIQKLEETRKYVSDVESFDWTIANEKPIWMVRANMPIIRQEPKIYFYDVNGKLMPKSGFNVHYRPYKSHEPWRKCSLINNLPLGCIDIKIENNGLVAYDVVFNIGHLSVSFNETSISKATVHVSNLNTLNFELDESHLLEIHKHPNQFNLNVKTDQFKIPTSIKGSLGVGRQRKLCFEIASPFHGLALVDKEGNIISERESLCLKNLYGLRILSTPKKETILSLKNKLNSEVLISKVIKETLQPLMTFKDEIVRLYYLADAMDFGNKVFLELKEGQNKKSYEISGFSHTLDISQKEYGRLSLFESDDLLDLFAIPVNDSLIDVTPIPLYKDDLTYVIPTHGNINQWIVISTKEDGNQLMPRFVNTDPDFVGIEKEERIVYYGKKLLSTSFENVQWKQLLALFNICSYNGYDLPFSTFDQFRTLSLHPKIAARAFLFLGIHQEDLATYIQKDIPEMEKDLGMCFHWIPRSDWGEAVNEISDSFDSQYTNEYIGIITEYLRENGLGEVLTSSKNVNFISHREISELRSYLGPRVLNELPRHSPRVTNNYGIPINQHTQVILLLQAPIAVAESINETQIEYPIWGADEFKNKIRRNIQYSQYLNPKFYNNIILHTLNHN